MTFLMLLIFISGMTTAAAQADKPPTLTWTDSSRDVYVDGELDRAARVFTCSSPRSMVLISAKFARAIVLDLAERKVKTMAKEALQLAPDKASAASNANAPAETIGKYTTVLNSVYNLSVDGKSILIARHTGINAGEISEEKLLDAVPVWRSLMEGYEPATEAVEKIKACDIDTKITIALGTWCPESKRYVPHLLKALSAAGNRKLHVNLIAVDNQFHEPMEAIQQHRLINVPTVIVEQEGRELGRIVEVPSSKTIEEDLALILNRAPYTHKARWKQGSLVARGAYLYRNHNGKVEGTEQWQIYRATDGGHIVHSEIKTSDLTTDVWYQADAKRRPTFVEVTKRRADGLTRARYYVEGQRMTAQMRGNETGSVEQTITFSENALLSSPAIAADSGWLPQPYDLCKNQQAPAYFISDDYRDTFDQMSMAGCNSSGEETVRVPAGEFRARLLKRKTGTEASDWWLHAQLGIPVRGRVSGGPEYLLTSLEIVAPKK